MKTFFPRKQNTFSSKVINVQSFLFFFCQINFIMMAENTFLRNITTLYAFYSKFTTFSDFLKNLDFFRKTHLFSFKIKPNFWTLREILLFQSHSTANLLQFDGKKLTFKHVNNRCWLVYASSIGKHRVKNTYLRGRFCFHILKNKAQNKNYDNVFFPPEFFSSFAIKPGEIFYLTICKSRWQLLRHRDNKIVKLHVETIS